MAWELAQVNIARLLAPIDDPSIDEFRNALDHINRLGESSPGFVWRLEGDAGGPGSTDIRWPDAPDDPLTIVNLTVWTDLERLRRFVYQTEHVGFLRRKRAWFEVMAESHVALWWVPAGHRPDVVEASDRLRHLRADGPSPRAFTLRTAFDPPQAA